MTGWRRSERLPVTSLLRLSAAQHLRGRGRRFFAQLIDLGTLAWRLKYCHTSKYAPILQSRYAYGEHVVLQATHENKNWSTVLLDASNAGIARNCWGARSCQRSTPCVLKKIVSRWIQKHAWLRWGGKHSTADVCKEGELTMVTSGPFQPGRSFRPDPPLPPDPSPFPGPPLPEPTPMPEPPPVPDPSPFPGPPPHMRSEGTAPF